MEHVDGIRAGHNGIAKARDHQHIDAMLHTVFQNHIAVMAMDTA